MLIDPARDVVIERHLKAPPPLVWRCWSEPDLFCRWYMPKPFALVEAVLDLRPGGRFYMLAEGPDGQRFPNEGAFLEAVPACKLVFTDLMTQDYAPVAEVSPDFGPSFTAILTFAPQDGGTLYRTVARHRSPAEAKANIDLGFGEGWAVTAGQLDELSLGLMP